ncbi:MAG: hypothetical protein U0326_23635 [Polyangiales bacterium]
MSLSRFSPALLAALFVAACDDTPSTTPDAAPADVVTADASDATPADAVATDAVATDAVATDVTNDSPSDTSVRDVSADAPADVTTDVATDAPAVDASVDVSVDASVDVPVDVSVDVPVDGSVDVAAADVAVDPPDAAGLCASLPANTAPVIMDTFTVAPMPSLASLTGGVVPAGTYYETQHIYHGVASGTVHAWQATTVFSPGATVAAVNISRDGAVFQQLAERIAYTGGAMSVTIACPSALAGTMLGFGYTYAAGSLRVYSYLDNTESVFTLQP